MGNPSTIDKYFMRLNKNKGVEAETSLPTFNIGTPMSENRPTKSPRIERNDNNEVDIITLERDPGLRPRIWDYNVNQRDEIRRAYIKAGPYQPLLSTYPRSGKATHLRSFHYSWFQLYPSWLEYSPTKDAIFCLSCYLFSTPSGSRQIAFTIAGFRNWKKVKDGQNCALLNHVGKDPNSPHRIAERSLLDLMNQPQHIQKVIDNYTSQEKIDTRLGVKTPVDAVRWLALQGCAFRGHNEAEGSLNRGNFIEMIKFLAEYDEKVAEVVLDKAPKTCSYTSPEIQKKNLHVLASKVKNAIRDEIGNARFCIIVDEAQDESKKEQMSIVLRFFDKDGHVRERFFGVVHVPDTAALTLQNEIYSILSHHNLDIQNIRGQEYDGASNMRGEWNGLKALILRDSPQAYYVHCFAHQLQLALVAASKDVIHVYHFFKKLTNIVNTVGASCKQNDEFKCSQAEEIAHLIAIDKLESGSGLNQIGTLQRAGDTRWSSHLRTPSKKGDVDAAYEAMTSFEFVFILHLMKETMELTDILCQALQRKTQDILNAIRLVSSTKALIQTLRDDKWDSLINNVKSFFEIRNIDVPDMNARYVARKGQARNQHDNFSVEQYYRVDIFYATIDSQLQELNSRFNKQVVELLVLSSSLDPREGNVYFKIDDICQLVDKYYPRDFTDYEKVQLRTQLQHYELDVVQDPEFKKLTTISILCQWLEMTRRSTIHPLVYRIIVLLLTLPVSTATTERSFSAMHFIKTRLRNKMDDEILTDSLMVFIEREIVEKFSTDSVIDDLRDLKERRVPF